MHISYLQFNSLLGNIFRIETTIGDVDLQLIEVEERRRKGLPDNFPTPLLLIFSGSGNRLLAQDNYLVHHPVLGQQIWFIAPVMPDFSQGQHLQLHSDGSRCMYYQAFFS